MAKATITHKRPFWPSILGVISLTVLAVFIVATCTGCSVINSLLDGKSYNSNDATMEKWGNPTY